MTDRNRSDLDREQRNASNPNPTERPENRSTKPSETDRMGGNVNRDAGVGNENPDRLDSEHEGAGHRSTGNIEGDENLNRR